MTFHYNVYLNVRPTFLAAAAAAPQGLTRALSVTPALRATSPRERHFVPLRDPARLLASWSVTAAGKLTRIWVGSP